MPKKLDASGKQKWRVVVDYRKLSELSVGDKYPLPNISDLLDQLGRCQYFTTLDLGFGFHQIEIVRMPFGLKNAPYTFQRAMDGFSFTWMISSTTLQPSISRLTEVFKRFQNAKEVACLGHLITKEGVKPNPDKTSRIQNFSQPTNQKEITSFLGQAGYYRRFINKFARPKSSESLRSSKSNCV